MPQSLTFGPPMPVGVGTRHVRLSQAHVETLFGEGYRLTPLTALFQPNEEACVESVTIRGSTGKLSSVRLIAPCPDKTVVELSVHDLEHLGLKTECTPAQMTDGSIGCTIEGPKGTIVLAAGVFVRPRTLILPRSVAAELNLAHGASTRIQVMGDRSRIFSDVSVQVMDNAKAEFRVGLEDCNTLELDPTMHAYVLAAAEIMADESSV